MFCPNCGSEIAPGVRFCDNCGFQVSSEMAANATGESQSQAQVQNQAQSQVQAQAQTQTQIAEYQPQPEYQTQYQAEPSTYITPTNQGGAYPLDTNRDLVTYILLSVVTCGIYGYWFVYKMAQDTNIICEGDGDSTPGLVVFILLSILTCGIYSIYWQYRLAKRLDENAPRYGVTLTDHASDVLLWLLLGVFICGLSFVGMFYIIRNLNTMSDAYNRAYGLV